MNLEVAIAGSNLDYSGRLPAFFAIVAAQPGASASIPRLPVDEIKAKQTHRSGGDPFEFSSLEEIVAKYKPTLAMYNTRKISPPKNLQNHVYDRTVGIYRNLVRCDSLD